MLIRVRGGESGIKEYLESGQKDGRNHSRDELDERVVLSGDLELTDSVINNMSKSGERYLHITLAFKEDELSRETLRKITEEFQRFSMTAYEADEYNFYAEAHLPKLKTYINQKTGELVERKPHIHIIIPEYNLLSQRNLNPFGKVDQQTKFLEAFQEHINAKYGLASPKDNRRIEFTDESAIISRYKGDYFKGANHDLKEHILSAVLDQGVTDFDQFQAIVAEHGSIKTRNAGKPGEYLNVRPPGAAKGVNLKEYVFSREFIEMPTVDKQKKLIAESRSDYEKAQASRPTPLDISQRLQEWQEVRAAEVKYINSGNRKAYAAYREANRDQRREILAERAATFYAKHRVPVNDQEPQPVEGLLDIAHEVIRLAPSTSRDDRKVDSVVGQYQAERQEREARSFDRNRAEFDTIKRELDATRLLAVVSRTHGVIPSKYEVTKGRDGSDRIRCGNRNLNVTDFLTQELHLPWREAAPILRQTHGEQKNHEAPQPIKSFPRRDLWANYRQEWQPQQRERREQDWKAQKQREQERRDELRRQYQAERRAIQNDHTIKATERKAALSLARMEKVKRDLALREQIEGERLGLKDRYNLKPAEQYRAYLSELSAAGNAQALAELRRQRMQSPTSTAKERIEDKDGNEPDKAPIIKPTAPASYEVDRDGNVTYYDDHKQPMFTDTGPAVAFEQIERDSLETGLRLALAKFGPNIRLRGGDDDYKHAMADIAADKGLYVEFSDVGLQERYEQRKNAIKAGRKYIDKTVLIPQSSQDHTPIRKQEHTPERGHKQPSKGDRET